MSVQTKMTAIADAIRKQTGSSGTLSLDQMADEINGFHTFNPPDSLGMSPEEIYRTTRPVDWLPMPVPGDDELYLLGLIPQNGKGVFTAKFVSSSNCTVAFGNLVNGAFVAKETITPSYGTQFFHTLYAYDYGDLTADSHVQYLVRIKGTIGSLFLQPDNKTTYGYGVPKIVDAVIGIPADIRFGGTEIIRHNCEHIRYIRYVGNAYAKEGGQQFRGCESLICVVTENTFTNSNVNYMFHRCKSLRAVSDGVFRDGVSCNYTFNEASVPEIRKKFCPSSVTGMFDSCIGGQKRIDGTYLDTNRCTSFSRFAYNCCLREISDLDISSATNFDLAFNLTALTQLTFAGETTPGGRTIDLSSGYMDHTALVNLINSLPTATAAAVITISGNPGVAELTDAEIAIATAKNWTVTI